LSTRPSGSSARFVPRESGEIGAPAFAQLKPAVAAPAAPDGHAGRGELIDIAQDRAFGNVERLRQGRRGHAPAGLQQHHDRQKTAGFHKVRDASIT
jgi:hypothetical protein